MPRGADSELFPHLTVRTLDCLISYLFPSRQFTYLMLSVIFQDSFSCGTITSLHQFVCFHLLGKGVFLMALFSTTNFYLILLEFPSSQHIIILYSPLPFFSQSLLFQILFLLCILFQHYKEGPYFVFAPRSLSLMELPEWHSPS